MRLDHTPPEARPRLPVAPLWVLKALRDPFQTDSQELFVSASVGISIYPQDAVEAETLQRNADNAALSADRLG